MLLNGVKLDRFQTTFSVRYEGGASVKCLFDAQGTGGHYQLGLQGDGSNVTVSLHGPDGSNITASSSSASITNISSSDTAWIREAFRCNN